MRKLRGKKGRRGKGKGRLEAASGGQHGGGAFGVSKYRRALRWSGRELGKVMAQRQRAYPIVAVSAGQR